MKKRILILVFGLLIVGAWAYAQNAGSSGTNNTPGNTQGTMQGTTNQGSTMGSTHHHMSSSSSRHHRTSSMSSGRVEGTVQSVDTTADTITVQVGNETKTFHYAKTTSFMNGRHHMKSSSLSTSLKAGDKVSIYADSKDNIRRLYVQGAASTLSSTTTPTTPKKKK